MFYSVAIDGPAGSGKSSVARGVAKRLGVLHLNTGSLYRAVGLYAYRNNLFQLDKNNTVIIKEDEINQIIKNVEITVKFDGGAQKTILNGEDVSALLTSPEVTDYSSRISPVLPIREYITNIQRGIAAKNNLVIEGRDITSHVLPNAKYKFYITASDQVRAERRYNEMKSKGFEISFDKVLKDIKDRDERDYNREHGRLMIVEDAIVLDSSNKNLEEMIDWALSYIKE